MPRTRIKICGIRRIEDALAAANSGADAIGLIFYPASSRAVVLTEAVAIKAALPPFVASVALFVNPDRALVDAVVNELRPNVLQFHGDEDADFCISFNMPYLKAIRIGGAVTQGDLLQYKAEFASAQALLLDKLDPFQYGGSGESFDWQIIPHEMRNHIVLAGGLNFDNVARAVDMVRPWAVDVSSGVESNTVVDMKTKDHAKIAAFIQQVRQADQDANV
mgnify:CR=1 FL=1